MPIRFKLFSKTALPAPTSKPSKTVKTSKQIPVEPTLKPGDRIYVLNPRTGEREPGHWILGAMDHKDARFGDRQAWQVLRKGDTSGNFMYRFPEHVQRFDK